MIKQGILHDYDLMANAENSAKENTCVICGVNPVIYQWSDYSGEGMCTQCGFPYQLKWGSDEAKKEGKYPYNNIPDKYIPAIKEYWNETHQFVHLGCSLSNNQGVKEFNEWLEKKHPEFCKDNNTQSD
jgi:hypothetical protein